MNQIMNIKTTIILLLNITLISLSYLYKDITPIAIIVLALYSFYLHNKVNTIEQFLVSLNQSFDLYKKETGDKSEEFNKKTRTDLNVLFDNQKVLLSVINSLRARINNLHVKNKKIKPLSAEEKLKDIRKRETYLNEE